MSQRIRAGLQYRAVDDVIGDVRLMRRVGYEKHGNWSLPQICWHVGQILEKYLKSPAVRSCTPEQEARRKGFLETLRKPGGASQFPAPPESTPPENLNDDATDHFLSLLDRLKNFPDPLVEMGPLGAAPLADFTEAHLLHSAHHFGFLKPKAGRRSGLNYAGFDEAIADIERLKKGYLQIGNWTLPQICHHCSWVTEMRLRPGPFPADTEEQRGRSETLKTILATRKIPRLAAPEPSEPPETADASAVEKFISVLKRCETFPGPFAPHRLFGTMSDEDARRSILIHTAHHLSFLVPTV